MKDFVTISETICLDAPKVDRTKETCTAVVFLFESLMM